MYVKGQLVNVEQCWSRFRKVSICAKSRQKFWRGVGYLYCQEVSSQRLFSNYKRKHSNYIVEKWDDTLTVASKLASPIKDRMSLCVSHITLWKGYPSLIQHPASNAFESNHEETSEKPQMRNIFKKGGGGYIPQKCQCQCHRKRKEDCGNFPDQRRKNRYDN